MTPLALDILLWLARGAHEPYPNLDREPQQEVLRRFEHDDIIDRRDFPKLTARGEAWLAMILDTPLPVQQWIDPRAKMADLGEFRGYASNLGEVYRGPQSLMERAMTSAPLKVEPSLPSLPEGFTAWGGELGTRFDPELKQDVAVTVPNGIGVDAQVVVFQRNGKVRNNPGGGQTFAAGSVKWTWAKEPDLSKILAGKDETPEQAQKKAAERFKRQQAEDVIGYAVIPGKDDHLRRDL